MRRATKVWSPDFLKFRQLMPENRLPVGLRHLKVEINFGLGCEKAICADGSEHVHQKVRYTLRSMRASETLWGLWNNEALLPQNGYMRIFGETNASIVRIYRTGSNPELAFFSKFFSESKTFSNFAVADRFAEARSRATWEGRQTFLESVYSTLFLGL